MIRLSIQFPNQPVRTIDWVAPLLTIGRTAANDVAVPADNVSGQHAQIFLDAGHYIFRDLHSTNGSIVVRNGHKILLRDESLELPLRPGDRVCLSNLDNAILVEAIVDGKEDEEFFDQTIIAEEFARPVDLETTLGDDSDALRNAVRLAREMNGLESIHEIAQLCCQSCLRAFVRARRVLFLVPRAGDFAVEYVGGTGEGEIGQPSTLIGARFLLDRCLAERKGFLFLFEENRMRAIATRVSSVESLDGQAFAQDRIVLCCPLFQNDRCYGFIEIEAPLGTTDRQGLTRRDLSLATLMGYLVSSRLHDLENQNARLKLARKATAGFLAATVGHCFKNLLFVPMSISKMLPLCLEQGKLEEARYMMARNSVNIRYLDMLSNEFASASKDPSEGFGTYQLLPLLEEVVELINQIRPDKIQAQLAIAGTLPSLVCHAAALRRLLMNLTLNSVDAWFGTNRTDMGRIDLAAEAGEAGDSIRLLVRDNGPGMPAPILTNLREIFRQVQSSADALGELQGIAERVHSTKDQGLKEHYGLGFLFVCQTVQQHQGNLELDSRPNEGTWFRITLPQRRPPTVAAVEESGAA